MRTTTPAARRVTWQKVGLALAVAPILACAVGLSAPSAEGAGQGQNAAGGSDPGKARPKQNKGKGKNKAGQAKAKTPEEQQKAREAAAARRKAREEAESAETTPLPDRPKKVVTPPGLTPAAVDALVEAGLVKAKVPHAPVTTDVEFVRRVYLDVAGKLPTPEQTRSFVNARGKDKRAKLVDQLLAGPDYATNWARYWRDVITFHSTNPQVARPGGRVLEEWLAERLKANTPWDEVAHGLIAASGRTDENKAGYFSIVHENDPVELAGEVSRIFLGVQIACAQCHDHPTDPWKRQQFHEFAAFFAKPRPRPIQRGMGGTPAIFDVALKGKPRYTMPDLKDPQTKVPVSPAFFLGLGGESKAPAVPAGLTARQRHELASSLITGQDNPWFARAFVNRVWSELVGEPFYSPVDDLGPQRTAQSPEVLDALATAWQKGGYDVAWLFRTILNTRTYQREVRSTYSASGRTPFASNCPSRLRADQILDALAQVLNIPADGPARGGPNAKGKGKEKEAEKGSPGDAKAARKDSAALTADLKAAVGKVKAKGMARGLGQRLLFEVLFGVDPSTPHDDVLGTIPQALMLMNGPLINRAIEARPATVLGQILTTHPDNRAALDALYLRVLARTPNPKEVETCGRYLDAVGNRREAFEDILWSLINSTEFITRR
jgi:hypothetical protein